MSSKTAKKSSAERVKPSTKWPIARVLAVFYTLSASVILLLVTGLLYWTMRQDIERANDHSLADQVEVVRLIMREEPNDTEELRSEIQSEGAARRFARYYARVLDEDNHILTETKGMTALLAVGLFPPPVPLGRPCERGSLWKSPDGIWFLLMAAEAGEGSAQNIHRTLQAALDVTDDEDFLVRYRRTLLIILVLGMLCSATVGSLVARKGMQPLAEITDAAQRITAFQLHERIAPARWPKELSALATAFDEMLGRLEASFNRLSQFSADLAHEFRTPITNLRTQAEVALTRSRSAEEYRRVLESSLEEYATLSRMVDSLLFLARSENAETVLLRSTLQAEREINAVVDFYEAMAAEKRVVVRTKGQGTLEADSALFRRAVSNLLANALHHTPAGGEIVVFIHHNAGLEITVEDTGCGIAPEHLTKIFDRFYRVDRARSGPGAGLGLAIVKTIVELHGGTASLHSEPGKGTRVALHFPPSSQCYHALKPD